MSDEVQKILEKYGFDQAPYGAHVEKGWWPILERLLPQLKAAHVKNIDLIKEKFGGLRVYLKYPSEHDDEAAWQFLQEAVAESYRTCEYCGAPGTVRDQPRGLVWIKVRCDPCQENHLKRVG